LGAKCPAGHYLLQMWPSRAQAELIQAARGGDGPAFDELLAAEYRVAFRVAYGLLQDVDEAEDAVQDSAFKAWRKLGNLREGSDLRPWFLAIVANHCRSLTKSRWWSVIRTDVPAGMADQPDPAGIVDLRRAVARMGHDDKLVLVLRYYLDLPFEEIAATMDITPKAARRRVEKAVARLRPAMQIQEALV
jgi:RNA polymerase sigma factor (sigma-70 family)